MRRRATGPSSPIRLSSQADRKSTRLNSSHGYISYAVFCLKKKKSYQTHKALFTLTVNISMFSTSLYPSTGGSGRATPTRSEAQHSTLQHCSRRVLSTSLFD